MVILTISAGLLMVSNILFSSFKQIDLKGKVPFITIVGLMIAGAIVVSEPPIVLFGVFMLYVASGPVLAAWRWIKKRG
jgi:CDP-diacylglycerol--serine O-phosphatidyltransferase